MQEAFNAYFNRVLSQIPGPDKQKFVNHYEKEVGKLGYVHVLHWLDIFDVNLFYLEWKANSGIQVAVEIDDDIQIEYEYQAYEESDNDIRNYIKQTQDMFRYLLLRPLMNYEQKQDIGDFETYADLFNEMKLRCTLDKEANQKDFEQLVRKVQRCHSARDMFVEFDIKERWLLNIGIVDTINNSNY